jgi:hypothetical protein
VRRQAKQALADLSSGGIKTVGTEVRMLMEAGSHGYIQDNRDCYLAPAKLNDSAELIKILQSRSPDEQMPEALAVKKRIETALHNIRNAYGNEVLSGKIMEIGGESIGSIWNRYLIQAGIPATFEEREQIAKRLGLKPAASLILMGAANEEKISISYSSFPKRSDLPYLRDFLGFIAWHRRLSCQPRPISPFADPCAQAAAMPIPQGGAGVLDREITARKSCRRSARGVRLAGRGVAGKFPRRRLGHPPPYSRFRRYHPGDDR